MPDEPNATLRYYLLTRLYQLHTLDGRYLGTSSAWKRAVEFPNLF